MRAVVMMEQLPGWLEEFLFCTHRGRRLTIEMMLSMKQLHDTVSVSPKKFTHSRIMTSHRVSIHVCMSTR